MKKLLNELSEDIKLMTGNVVCFGIEEEKLMNEISKNSNILNCDLLTNKKKTKGTGKNKGKTVYIKKLRKKYKKNKIDYIIGNLKEVDKFKRTFIRDSIYINKTKMYLFFDNNYDGEPIIRRYNRYKTVVVKKECLDGTLYVIDASKASTNWLLDFIYNIVDTIIDIFDIIGDVLAS